MDRLLADPFTAVALVVAVLLVVVLLLVLWDAWQYNRKPREARRPRRR